MREGTVAGHKLSLEFKEKLNMIFGACAMTMGISTIIQPLDWLFISGTRWHGSAVSWFWSKVLSF
ncbi:MAG: hypothetical protein IIU28_06975 [Lachnospiraceae bacterium]|nr:hypothetical protein [Lachnospiraceae bacterium]